MHWNFNLVTGEVGEPHAILIRALEPLWGVELMAARRGLPQDGRNARELTNGPGKLCQALGITGAHYGVDLCQGDLHLIAGKRARIMRSPRVGIAYAGAWRDKPWRFFEAENPYVSGAARARLVIR
jgi:DNA-3-methyladenine glycosylase